MSYALKTLILVLVAVTSATAQTVRITGRVVEQAGAPENLSGIPGVTVYAIGSDSSSLTDTDGRFTLETGAAFPVQLVASQSGYQADTVLCRDAQPVIVTLRRMLELEEVQINATRAGTEYSTLKTISVESIGEKEIRRAACCNLSEAFETSPTVSVAYTDAVTGVKEIRLLGLSGIYTQLLTEAVPNFRGLAAPYGLYFLPGPWIQSIQVTKGVGAVQQGYEAFSGQVNIELKKPDDEDVPRLFVNVFGEQNGNMEVNIHGKQKINDQWSTIVMAHGNYMEGIQDLQDDGFLDIPHNKQVNLYNRWQYHGTGRLESQLGFRFIDDWREGGQYGSSSSHHGGEYTTDVANKRMEVFGKLGILFPEKEGKSIGNIVQLTTHKLDSRFGIRTYDAEQKTLFVQSLMENILDNPIHRYKAGVDYRYDGWNQQIQGLDSISYESVAGAFLEYTYGYEDGFRIIAGNRLDYHNRYGLIYTPRLHVKYNFTPEMIVRASAGRSFRVPNVYSDNLNLLACSKSITLDGTAEPERAWNFGVNATWRFTLFNHEATLNADFYRTEFQQQLIVDRITYDDRILLYNLEGRSFANSGQLTFNYMIDSQWEFRLSHKRDEVRQTYSDSLQRKPLVPAYKSLASISFKTEDEHWQIDATAVQTGPQRLLNTYTDSEFGSAGTSAPSFITFNLQVTKVFRWFELYGGAENLFNYYQEHPVINADDPFGNAFDATNVWAPLDGRRIYLGIRYSIQ